MIDESGRRYYLVCTEPPRGYWWSWILAPGFRHCFVLIWEGVCWLQVDPTLARTHVVILDRYEPGHPADWMGDPDVSVIEVTIEDGDAMRAPWVVGPVTCTEFVKSVLGIRSFWLWTPLQLFNYLRSRHGIETPEENR